MVDQRPASVKQETTWVKLNGQQGKFKVAEKHLLSAYSMCPSNVLTNYFLGDLYRQGPLFNKSKALFHLGKVLTLDPNFLKRK